MMTAKVENPALEFPVCEGDDALRLVLDRDLFARTGQASLAVTVRRSDGSTRTETLVMVPARS
jgi:hypothetical protein